MELLEWGIELSMELLSGKMSKVTVGVRNLVWDCCNGESSMELLE